MSIMRVSRWTYRAVSAHLDNHHNDDGSDGDTDHDPAHALNPVLKHVASVASLGVLDTANDDDELKQATNTTETGNKHN